MSCLMTMSQKELNRADKAAVRYHSAKCLPWGGFLPGRFWAAELGKRPFR